jgi:hypothetical protein
LQNPSGSDALFQESGDSKAPFPRGSLGISKKSYEKIPANSWLGMLFFCPTFPRLNMAIGSTVVPPQGIEMLGNDKAVAQGKQKV